MSLHQNKHKNKNDKQTAMLFLLGCVCFTLCIFLIATYMPQWMKLAAPSNFVMTHVLPLTFFTSFSFVLGILSLLGVINLLPFLQSIYPNKVVDLGIVSIVAGFFSIFIGSQFKKIVENLIGDKIQSSMIYDVVGFTLGRTLSTLLFIGPNYSKI
jgi:hypothetical protein